MKKKNRILNIAMIALIAMVGVCAVLAAGSIKGWFGGDRANGQAKQIIGIASIERNGVVYSISADTLLRDGDILTTRAGSSLIIEAGKNTLMLSEKTQVKIKAASQSGFEIELDDGEVFAVTEKGSAIILGFGENRLNTQSAIFSVSVQTGSSSVNVYAGEVSAASELTSASAKAGESISCLNGAMAASTLSESSLNDFNMVNVKKANDKASLCFTDEVIDAVSAAREEEKQKAEEERLAHEAEVIAKGGTKPVVSAANPSGGSSGDTGDVNKLYCTVSIRCDTILDNMKDLTAGKSKYVPANGVILTTSRVEFIEGETVFDVLKRACNAAGIQLEYEFTPMYNSYYIEGINNLYEFDCGSQSGWMYKVNGWFPNYGCSVYTLKGGDNIVWCYTCKGLGADVGGGI